MDFLRKLVDRFKDKPATGLILVGILTTALTIVIVVKWVIPAKEKTIREQSLRIKTLENKLKTTETERDGFKTETESLRKSVKKTKVTRPYVGADGKVVFGPDGKPVMIEESVADLLLAKDTASQEWEKEKATIREENSFLKTELAKAKEAITKQRGTGVDVFYFRDLEGYQGGDVNFPVLGPVKAGLGLGLAGPEVKVLGRVGVNLDDIKIF